MNSGRTSGAALALALGWAAVAQGAETLTAVRVRNIGPGPLDETFITSQCRVRAGDALDRAAVAADVRALLDTGRFTEVKADVGPAANGVELVYSVAAKLRLAEPVAVRGARAVRESRVRELLGLQPGDLVDDPTVAARAAKVRDAYREKHMSGVRITWTLEAADVTRGLGRLTVQIDETARARLESLRFPGRRGLSEADLRKALNVRNRWNPVGWVRGNAFDLDELQAGREALRQAYRAAGYLDVKVGELAVHETQPGRMGVEVPIEEGPRYQVGTVRLKGVTLFPEEAVLRAAALTAGTVVSPQALGRAAEGVRDHYEGRGYMPTYAVPRIEPRAEPGVVDVLLEVHEGALSYIRDVVIRNNHVTRDAVIRRELLVAPGDEFDGVRARRSENRLRNLGYFAQVSSYPEPTAVSNRYDLVFEVEEQRTGQLMVGAGFSSIDDFVVFGEISQGNFDLTRWPPLGGGQKLKLRGQYGDVVQDYSLSFVEPWFLGRRLSLGVDLYTQQRDEQDYDVERIGAALSLGHSLGGPNRLNWRYQLEKVGIASVADTNEYMDVEGQPFYFLEVDDRIASSLGVTYSRDTRDNVFIPTRGSRVTLAGTLMGGPLGFDTDLYDLEANGSLYIPLWFRHVLSLRGRVEVLDVYGGTEEVPISERLFLGGARTVRGFRYRWVGPKAVSAATGEVRPSGGQTLALASAEYTVPVVSGVRVAAFYDIGSLGYGPYEFEADALASGAGLGVRLDIPGFPMRFDYAWPIDKDDDATKVEHFTFSVTYGY